MALPRKVLEHQSDRVASNSNLFWSILAYIGFYPTFLFVLLWLLLSTEKKLQIIDVLTRAFGWSFDKLNGVPHETVRLLVLLLCFLSLGVGFFTLVSYEYRRFKRTSAFEFPVLGKWLPSISNYFYDENYTEELSRNKNLKGKVTHLEKTVDRLSSHLAEADEDKKKLAKELANIVQASDKHRREVDKYIMANHEMVKLMDNVLALVSFQGPTNAYNQEFWDLMDEFANTITKVTTDQINDKYSSIMRLDKDHNILRIVGCNGLGYNSRRRTFQKGQGFAGSLWETGNADVCHDIEEDARFRQPGCAPSGPYRSIMGVPIVDSERGFIGALFVQSRRTGVFNLAHDLAILSNLSILIAICFSDYERRRSVDAALEV